MDARYLMLIGFILLFVGILFIIISSFLSAEKSDTKVAVGGIIGFIPFGFGTDKRFVLTAMIIAAVVLILFLILRYFLR